MTHLFVYGSLKSGCKSHALLAGQLFVSEARTVTGFRLFQLDGYPGLVAAPDTDSFVTGELWSVDSDCLAILDEFEGVAEGLYRRQSLALVSPATSADAYVYTKSLTGRRPIGPTWKE